VIVYLKPDLYGSPIGGSATHTEGISRALNAYVLSRTNILPVKKRWYHRSFLWELRYNWTFFWGVCFTLNRVPVRFFYMRFSRLNFVGPILAWVFEAPLVLEHNGSEVWIQRHWGKPLKFEWIYRWVEKFNLKHATLVVTPSSHVGLQHPRAVSIPTAADPRIFRPMNRPKPVQLNIGFVGTFGKWHGASFLTHAFGWLLNQHKELRENTKLLLIGDGPDMKNVKETILGFGIQDNVHFTGEVKHALVPDFLEGCRICVCPTVPNVDGSEFFGSPTKLFEYMAMGKAVIASKIGMIPEIIKDGINGRLFTPGDCEDLRDCLYELITNPEFCEYLGKQARISVLSGHSWSHRAKTLLEELECKKKST